MTEDAYSLHLPPAASAHNKPEEAPEQGEAQQVTEPLQAEAEVELQSMIVSTAAAGTLEMRFVLIV